MSDFQDPPGTPPDGPPDNTSPPPAAGTDPTAGEEQPYQSQAAQAGPKVYHSEIDPALQEMVKAQIIEAVKGNGLKPDDVKITKFEGETLEFLAITELKLDSKISIKRQAGKQKASKQLPSANGFQEEVNREIAKIRRSPDVIDRMQDAILQRPDKGLCLENVKIKLPFLHRDYVAHEPCNACGAKGKIQCTRCQGKGREQCPQCHGRGTDTCPTCGGRQYIQGPNNQNQQCQRCNGSGRIGCTRCHETRMIQCSICKGVGKTQCKQCNGHAWNSAICLAEIDPIAHYGFDRENMPPKPLEIIDELGSDIQHHTNIEVIRRHAEMERERDDIMIPYHIKAPMAEVEVTLKEKLPVPAFMFGIQARLYYMPPFLEKIMGPGIKALKQAAHGQGDVAALLQKAGRYKTLRHLILATSKTKPKKALDLVMQANPIGLSGDNTKKMVLMAAQALSLMSKRPRRIGIALGILLAAALGGAYYAAGRAQLAPMLPAIPNAALIADALAGLVCIGIAAFAAKAYTDSSVKKALKNLLG